MRGRFGRSTLSWYEDQLQDPRWQRKRLEIMSRDEWCCLRCGRGNLPLTVHHRGYDGLPWQADDFDLETLCKPCHDLEHEGAVSLYHLRQLIAHAHACRDYDTVWKLAHLVENDR